MTAAPRENASDRQRQLRVLLELDDRLLDDIGVSREAARAEGRKLAFPKIPSARIRAMR